MNPGVFHGEDVSCVLAYATLMLNTDLHSKSIKNKMTKDQFCRNLRGADDGHDINRKFLELLFDRVEAHEIQMMDDNEYRGGKPAGKKWRSDIIKLLGEGGTFLKYGRSGNPHERVIWVSPDLQYVCYGTVLGTCRPEQRIAVRDIHSVVKGMTTEVFHRVVPEESERTRIEGRCFTLDASRAPEGRTFDLEATSEAERKKFFDAFRFLVNGFLTD